MIKIKVKISGKTLKKSYHYQDISNERTPGIVFNITQLNNIML